MPIYGYIGLKFNVVFDKHVEKPITSFLDDYFHLVHDNNEEPAFTVELVSDEYKNTKKIIERGNELIILNGSMHKFYEKGFSYDDGYVRSVYNSMTKGVYHINYVTNKVTVYNKDLTMLTRDGKRVIRDLVKVCVEQEKDAILYHGAVLEGLDGQGVMLMGDKSSGKTPTSLKMMFDYGFNEVSRDKVFVKKAEGENILFGWPTHYNLTMRTLRSFESLNRHFPQELSDYSDSELDSIRDKMQLMPSEMGISKKSSTAKLSHIVLLTRNKKGLDVWDMFARNCYSPKDPLYTNWHNWSEDNSAVVSKAKALTKELVNHKNILIVEREENLDNTVKRIVDWVKEAEI